MHVDFSVSTYTGLRSFYNQVGRNFDLACAEK